MAVDAVELRPRNTVAIFDAAVRLTTTSSGLWALTLPSGAALIAAGLTLADAVQRHRSVLWPAALWTVAWVFRALSQGAACHYAEQQVLGLSEPNVWASWLAVLKRAPSVITTCAFLFSISLLVVLFTGGIGFFFFGAHAVGYAVVMRGQGHPFKLLATSATLLGPARFTAAMVRVCGLVQVILALNLHLAVGGALYLVTHVVGLDLTYASHFAVITNPVWLTVIALATFTCFEPIRAATAALLLIDGRVRQEGLDLVAAVEQLPKRKRPSSFIGAVVVLLLIAPHASAAPSALRSRVERLARQCHIWAKIDRQTLDDLDALSEKQRGSAARFISRVERRAYDDEDCQSAETDLNAGLKQLHEARALEAQVDAQVTRAQAQSILERPEFQTTPPAEPEEAQATEEEPPGWFRQWWDELWQALDRWLRNQPDPEPDVKTPTWGGPMPAANAVMLLALGLAIALGGFLIFRFTRRTPGDQVETDASVVALKLSQDPMSALSKPAQTWASLADALAAQGEFREAIRHLYLAFLARLHADGRITYDTTRSNWEYLRELKAPSAVRVAFRELTRRFDFAWYGHLLVDPDAYDTFRELTSPLLAEAVAAEGVRRA